MRRRVALFGAACVLLVFLRERRRRQRREAALLGALKAANRKTFLAVSDRTGTRFVERSLRSMLKRRGVAVPTGSRLELASALLEAERTTVGPCKRRPRHALVRGAVDGASLRGKFAAMKAAYAQQALDYGPQSRYGNQWRISCYLVVLEKWKPKIAPHPPMVAAMGKVMRRCVRAYEDWYASNFDETKEATVMNCFVTRYSGADNQLEKHVDGANVDGSVILACPTDDPFQGGALKVWERKKEYHYDDMRPGDCIFLEGPLWHQAMPISTGTRYALVLFLSLRQRRQQK